MRSLLVIALISCGCSTPRTNETPARSASGGIEIGELSGLGLFRDEQAQAQAMLADTLRARGFEVIDPALTRRAWALTAEGKDPRSGAECGRALAAWTARKRWGPALGIGGVATSSVWCESDGGCELSLYVAPLDDDARPPERLRASLSPTGAPLAVLPAALASLQTPEPSRGGGGLLGSLGSAQPLQVEDLLRVHLSPADRRDRTRVDDVQEASAFPGLSVTHLATCLPGTDSSVSLLLELGATGELRRCEAHDEEGPEASCACGQLARVGRAPWLAGRRWQVSLSIDRRDQVTRDGRLRLNGYWQTSFTRPPPPGSKRPKYEPHVEDPSIAAWTPGSARLAVECFVDAFPEPGHLNSRWGVWFDGAGRAAKVVEQKGFPPLPPAIAACVQRALKTAQAPCPARPNLWAIAVLNVNAADPNASPMNVLGK